MPLYEYHCSKCGKNFEVIQKFSDAPLTTHEECGGKVEKLMSAPSFHLKGSGWYVTDYGKGGKVPAADGKSEKKETESSGTKSDSPATAALKAETKTEAKPAATPAKSE
jgi:putative FmdB family regulatory protein